MEQKILKFHRDHQNSIIALSDENGQIVEYYEYSAFGTIIKSETMKDDQGNTIQTYNPYRYTGREYDTPDLYYYRARYYDPTLGKFITPDPIGFLGGDMNLHRYVGNDPVNFVDYSGMSMVATGGKSNFTQPILADVMKGTTPLPPKPRPSKGGGSAAPAGKDGMKVKGNPKPIEPMKYLYFVCYQTGSNRGDGERKKAAQARINEIIKTKKFNRKIHKVYIIKTKNITLIGDEIQKKVAEHGGDKKVRIKEATIFAYIDHDHLTQWHEGKDAIYGYGFDEKFIKKTNQKLGKYITLIKAEAKELSIGSFDVEFSNKYLKKANMSVGNLKLPNLEAKTNTNGYSFEAGAGFNTWVGKAQSDEIIFKIPYMKSPVKISGSFELYAGGLMATAHASSEKENKTKAKKNYGFGLTFAIGLGASITIDF